MQTELSFRLVISMNRNAVPVEKKGTGTAFRVVPAPSEPCRYSDTGLS
jgi:hypothetical protein